MEKVINKENTIFFTVLFIIFIFATNMYNYFEGDRVPNLSILICAIIGYFSLKNVFNEIFSNIIMLFNTLWQKYITNKYDFFFVLNVQLKGFIFLIFIYLMSLKLINNNYIYNSISNGRLLWLYMYAYNSVYFNLYNNINNMLYLETLIYKFYNIFIIVENYKNIAYCWKWLWDKSNNVTYKFF